jgi:threonine dehydratase
MKIIQQHRLSLERIERAHSLIDCVFTHSPQLLAEHLGAVLGFTLVLKIETLNPIRSFKGRGAHLLVQSIQAPVRLVCASAGNFGQAMAYAAQKRGIPLTVYAGKHANTYKIERMRALGAEVILHGSDFDAAKLEARRVAELEGYRFVEDGADIETLEGAATIALELLQFSVKPDVLLIPLGNGALFNGMSFVMKNYSPSTRLVAVQSEGAPAMVESYRTGNIIVHDNVRTIADGIAVRIPVAQALDDMKGMADDTLLVSEGAILEAMKLVLRHVGLVAEPAAVVGIAALLENGEMFRGKTVGTVICGGNLTEEQIEEWL